jgi:hypothetical protein
MSCIQRLNNRMTEPMEPKVAGREPERGSGFKATAHGLSNSFFYSIDMLFTYPAMLRGVIVTLCA